jgi:hypothetical protein
MGKAAVTKSETTKPVVKKPGHNPASVLTNNRAKTTRATAENAADKQASRNSRGSIVRLKHNPFTLSTEMTIDGNPVACGALIELTHNNGESKRLQQWIDQIIPALVKDLNTRDFSIEFYGIPEDFCDLQEASDQYEISSGSTIPIIHQTSPEHRSFTAAQRMTRLKQLFEELKKSPIEKINDSKIIEAFEDAISPDFEVSVIATMKAGKSTLINALLGQDLLPSQSEVCTATITQIRDCDDRDRFIGQIVNDNENTESNWQDVTKSLLEEWNLSERDHCMRKWTISIDNKSIDKVMRTCNMASSSPGGDYADPLHQLLHRRANQGFRQPPFQD